jgi:SSS family solute:Na+ symporter
MVDLSALASIGFSKANDKGIFEIPFLDRMGIVFALCVIGMIIISLVGSKASDESHALEIDARMFKVSNGFAIGAAIAMAILTVLYFVFW